MADDTPTLNKPRRIREGEPGYGEKKYVVTVRNPKTGNTKTLRFGDAKLGEHPGDPERKKSYCARSAGQGDTSDKTKALYWARRQWKCE